MIKEFREFLFRGNVVDLAVAVVIGTAFTAVINSLVGDIITPLLGLLGLPDLSAMTIQVGNGDPPATINLGTFINVLISFVVIALAIFFIVVRPMNALKARRHTDEAAPAGPTEIELLTQIRDELAKRA